MPAYYVERSITIEKPPAQVVEFVSDFRSWPTWSPWLIMEPQCKVEYQGTPGQVGAGYHWTGNMVGEGRMALLRKTESNLDIELEFIKPFKSMAMANFKIEPNGNGSKVTWMLDAALPWFLFFLKKTMEQSLGMDYERGLKMLKSLIETGDVPSQLTLLGEQPSQPSYYIGIERTEKIDNLGTVIPNDYKELAALFAEQGYMSTGAPFTLYFSMEMDSKTTTLRNCFPVTAPVEVSSPYLCEQLPSSKTYVVKHEGEYPMVSNAWALAMFAARHNKVKLNKKPVGLERYISDPERVPANELVTEVVLFQK